MIEQNKTSLALGLAICLSPLVSANHANAEEAHLHGAASMEVVIDNGALEIRFVSPADSIVGFEHEAESEQEREAVSSAKAYLLEGAEIFKFADAGCELKESETDFGHLMESDHPDDNEHHDEDGHHSDEEHAKDDDHSSYEEHADADEHVDSEAHAEHGDHSDDDEEHSDDTHSDIEATYHFSCEPDKSVQFDVDLFDRFSGLESIQVRWITASGQGHTQLSSVKNTVLLSSE